ncbi:hypothetical protein SH501x_000829 [Pirellulaceae bacterium SH501]
MSNRSSIPVLHAKLKYPEHLISLEDMMDFIYEDGFIDDWRNLGLDEETDLACLEYTLTATPDAGEVIAGTGGLRKFRWRVPGKGKRGGLRVIYMFVPEIYIIYCFVAYPKSQTDLLSDQALKTISVHAKSVRNRLLLAYAGSGRRAL